METTQTQLHGFLNTPPLWTNMQFGISQFDFPSIDLGKLVPKPIPQNRRLGHQMEYVFEQLIAHSDTYKILLQGLPVKNSERTLGEIDFILKVIPSNQLIHVELTYKFYIIDLEISEPIHRLMGPNRRDMFFTKMEKINKEQFPLLHSPEGILALRDNAIDPERIEHRACFKAQLFVPFGSTTVSIRPLNRACIRGYWIRFDDFNSPDYRSHNYYIPFKSQWVIAPHEGVPWQSHRNTLMEINLRMLKENAPMVWMKKTNGELHKFFVVWW